MLKAGDTDNQVGHRASAASLSPRGQDLSFLGIIWVTGLIVTALPLMGLLSSTGLRNPALDIILDAVNACIALLAAYLVHGRFLRQGRLQDLLLAHGLVLLALAGLGVTVLTDAIDSENVQTASIWLPVAVLSVAAVLIAGAALFDAPAVRRTETKRWSAIAAVTTFCVLAALILILSAVQRELSVILVTEEATPASSHPLALAGHGWVALWFFVASIAFAYRSGRFQDPLLRWAAPAFSLAGFARINYMLFPDVHTEWLYAGDVFRTACYLLLLVGATREIRQYWSAQAGAAVLEDRRRLARELHDGVIQELAYIKSQSLALPDESGMARSIVGSCNRALDEARAALHALGQSGDEALGLVLHRAAQELAERHAIDLEVDLDDSIDVGAEQQHALMRIAREAVSNAVRHGNARRVRIRLAREGTLRRMTIQDDGDGFDLSAALGKAAGYGLRSMRERAELLPGAFAIDTEKGAGSVVTVTW